MSIPSTRIIRTATGAVACVAAVVAIVMGIVAFQDWQLRRQIASGTPYEPLGPDNPPSAASFHPGRAVEEMPPITEIEIVSAEEVGGRIEDDELVIGVAIDGEARAYPLNVLTGPEREIFNDHLAGRPIAATW